MVRVTNKTFIMRNKIKSAMTSIASMILGALGFAGCAGGLDPDDPGVFMDMYGTPTCSFKVNVTVVDENGKALEGIKVIPAGVGKNSGMDERSSMMLSGKDTLSTDSKGVVSRTYRLFSSPEKLKIYFEDTANGAFVKDSAEFTPVKTGEGKGWYKGEWTVSGKKALNKK